MKSIVFLCSGGGGNVRFVHALIEHQALTGFGSVSVIADRECGAMEWARSKSIRAEVIEYTREKPGAMRRALNDLRPDVVVTTVHKILDDTLVADYTGRLVNLHYSLLPAFAGVIGMEAVRRARNHGCTIIGATAHRVTSELDGGPVLAQACIPDDPARADELVYDDIFRCGAIALASALGVMVRSNAAPHGSMVLAGRLAVLAAPSPEPAICSCVAGAHFWEALR